MWEGRQVLGTIFVRWRRKRFDCRLFLFSHRYWFIFPTVPLIEVVSYAVIEFRLGVRISASTCFNLWYLINMQLCTIGSTCYIREAFYFETSNGLKYKTPVLVN